MNDEDLYTLTMERLRQKGAISSSRSPFPQPHKSMEILVYLTAASLLHSSGKPARAFLGLLILFLLLPPLLNQWSLVWRIAVLLERRFQGKGQDAAKKQS